MKLKTIKQISKKGIILGIGAVLVLVSVVTLTLTRAKYRSVQSIKLASGTIKYTASDLQIVAIKISEDGDNYTDTTQVPTDGYTLSSKSSCSVNKEVDTNITITYDNGNITFSSLKKGAKCNLYFDKTNTETLVTAFGSIEVKLSSPDFAQVATGAETEENNGIFKLSDGMYGGYSYYWRGAATTNYVKFAGFCWRIIRINGDGSIRLIYDGITCHANGTNTAESIATSSVAYNPNHDQSYYVGWTYDGSQRTLSGTASNAKTQTESWYSSNITGANDERVAIGKFCNDRNAGEPLSSWSGYTTTWSANGTKFAYAGVDRLWNRHEPTLSCPSGDAYELKVGAITADEVELAGGKKENNTSYYLYNGQYYRTMSPFQWDGNPAASVFLVGMRGDLTCAVVNNAYGLRPVINLRSDVTFNAGSDGTQNNPYIVQ